MALIQFNYVISTSVFINTLSLFVSAQEYLKPQILAEYETIIDAGNNFTVLCQGNKPITWVSPEITKEKYFNWTQISVVDTLPKDKKFKYGSRLYIYNMTYPFTGFYKCVNKDVDSSDEELESKIYLYVKDEEHLSVSEEDVETVTAIQYETTIIPCRPTSPDVHVELMTIGGEKIDNATFDPKTGFHLYINSLTDQGYYYCTFSRGYLEYERNIFIVVNTMTHSLAKPIIVEKSGGHTIVGEQLVLECDLRTHTQAFFDWITPTGHIDPTRMSVELKKRSTDLIYERLTINKTTLADKGRYICNVSDNQDHNSFNSIDVYIFGPREHFINLTEENGVYEVSIQAGAPEVLWRIDVKGHPEPSLTWLNNNNDTIPLGRTARYYTNFTVNDAVLKINDVSMTDYGNYTLVAENEFEKKSLVLFLNVTDKPSVHIESDDFHLVNKESIVKCTAAAYPKPTIYWFFKNCQEANCSFSPIPGITPNQKGLQFISSANITAFHSGHVKCVANNSLGSDEVIVPFLVSDVEDGFNIFGFDSTIDYNKNTQKAVIAKGEKLDMTCGATTYNYTKDIKWFYNNKILDSSDSHTLTKSYTKYSNRLTLNIPAVTFVEGGHYSCQAKKLNGNLEYKNISLLVSKPLAPIINKTNLNKDIEMEFPKPLELFCEISGVPKPKINWFKNNELLHPLRRIVIDDSKGRVIFVYTKPEDEGTYKCEASNKLGIATKQMNLRFKNKLDQNNTLLIIIIGVLTVIVIITGTAIFVCVVRDKKLKRKLEIAGLKNFEKGALENINPDLGIDDQAELLPYEKTWEFPIEKLKLGKQLGSGAFGVVMKAEAKGIVEGEESTTVAVKMVKKNADNTYIKALASELKIMVHLGKHLNVVNLLGACTKNVVKRELLVIVEYCRYGNLQNYLFRHRDNFINQVDEKTGSIDYAIGQDILERTYSVSSNYSNPHSPHLKYVALSFSNSNSGGSRIPMDMVDYRGDNYNGTTAKTDITMVSMTPNSGDDGMVMSNNSVQPEWRSNYRGDYKGTVRPICTKDLLAWAFQVSRGMEYLASRKVLHGDLAARNILLADNNVVKICDFGLAKSMYKNDNYKKKGDGPLPVKWMAIESIRDRIFSTQSDVWSFGIVLWEFFSLARTPYPGMEADERLFNKLLDGYRMDSPDYAPKEMYKMMVDCWQSRPVARPTFSKLAERIGSLLEDSVRKHYIDLNDPYLVMNTRRLEDGQSDYLAMFTPPNFENLSSPNNYVNDSIPNEDTPGYLSMKPTVIFSPRLEEECVFDFSINKPKNRSVAGTGNELLPMLSIVNNESDCETSACNTPLSPSQSYSNPSYHLPPVVEKKPEKDIAKFSDNYVNMPQNKSTLIVGKNNYNPFSNDKQTTNSHYVNSNTRDWESVNA